MKNALIICTYMRPHSLSRLMKSVLNQIKIPDQIIIVDGSTNDETKEILLNAGIELNIDYYLVEKENRGLTKQRNYGVSKVNSDIGIVSFLDDDIILEPDYFFELEKTFFQFEDCVGVGGIDLEENRYFQKEIGIKYSRFGYYELDGWLAKESFRYKVRKVFGLMTNLQPDIIPDYSHGRTGFPPNGRTYKVEHFMGGIAAYRKDLFESIAFSSYFEGYGLYEDFDFCVRAMKFGDLYVNTNAKVWHFHEPSGRPNQFEYGKMVIRNGWYVWKLRFPENSIAAKFKWHATTILLTKIRLINSITGPKHYSAVTEYLGRLIGWFSLWFNPPKIKE